MEIVLLKESWEYLKVMFAYGGRAKKTWKRHLGWSNQTVVKRLHGQNLRLILLNGSQRNETMASPFYHRLWGWRPSTWQSTRNMGFHQGSLKQETTGANVSWNGMESLAQQLPDDFEEKIVRFHPYIINLHKQYSYPLHVTANRQNPLTFEMPPNRTICNSGEKTIKICTTGNEKNCITVLLACAGDRSKLRPMVIFKRKALPKVANKHGVIAAQENSWMDGEIMKT